MKKKRLANQFHTLLIRDDSMILKGKKNERGVGGLTMCREVYFCFVDDTFSFFSNEMKAVYSSHPSTIFIQILSLH